MNAVRLSNSSHIIAQGQFERIIPEKEAMKKNDNKAGGDTNVMSPASFMAEVTGATVAAFGRSFHVPLKGQGAFEVLYVDETLRIFRSKGSGGLTVQVRAELFPEEDISFIPK
uniref:Uncharacterized protein n=1 Tax=Lotharella oceanica TaxID=641309 RepID=A0A7S2TEY8_9EUKA|mmetsp:Transcript_1096/g.2074  ORF Transcript_1096/g.2074 Transcript_1096/m.2074 type:complete len:113 (+) Transcript_1096:190-528(+)